MAKRESMTEEQFLKEADHSMTVVKDDGLHRHLKFRRPGHGGWFLWFDLVTWPGNLTITGDMGTYVFARIDDMFSFFRSTTGLRINPDYWAEKVEAQDRTDGIKKFDYDYFRETIIDSLANWDLSETQKARAIELLDEDVFNNEESWEGAVRSRLSDFSAVLAEEWGDGDIPDFPKCKLRFDDQWEISGSLYVDRYLWCLYAIVWGIQQYDAAKSQTSAA